MPRYIDADKIIYHLKDEMDRSVGDNNIPPVQCGIYFALLYAKSLVETVKTADVQEIRHGRWNTVNSRSTQCSVCGVSRDIRTQVGWNFCPVCGAKMGEEDRK